MDRSNVPTKVEVRRADLLNIETTKAYHILKRLVDTGQPGIISGLTVQQSALGNDRFDILAGYGYAPNGELVELAATLEGQSAGNNVGLPALVGIMYRETETTPGAAETDGVARPRRVVRSSELRVFTADQWNALPPSLDSNLAADARDRFLVCAIVTRPLVLTDPLSIVSPPTFEIIKTIAAQPTNTTGLYVVSIDQNTPNSDPFPFPGTPNTGQLIYNPATSQLAYKAPFDTVNLSLAAPFNVVGCGNPVTVSAGGQFTLTSANGLRTIVVQVDPATLPSITATSTTDNLSVSSYYTQIADRGGARDDLHRHKLGSQIPSARNPHGLKLDDITTLTDELRGTLTLGVAYLSTLLQAEVPALAWRGNPLVLDPNQVQNLALVRGASTFNTGGLPSSIRLYRRGSDSLLLMFNARARNAAPVSYERLSANGDNPNIVSAMIEIHPSALVFYRHPVGTNTWTSWTVMGSVSFSTGSSSLNLSNIPGWLKKTDLAWIDGNTVRLPRAGVVIGGYPAFMSADIDAIMPGNLASGEVEQNSTWYYVYVRADITIGAANSITLVLSSEAPNALGQKPTPEAGFTASSYLYAGSVYNDSTGAFREFHKTGNVVLFNDEFAVFSATPATLPAVSNLQFFGLVGGGGLPETSRKAICRLAFTMQTGGAGNASVNCQFFAPSGSTPAYKSLTWQFQAAAAGFHILPLPEMIIPTTAGRLADVAVNGAVVNGPFTLDVQQVGYIEEISSPD